MSVPLPPKQLHSVAETCHILGVGKTTAYELIKRDVLPVVKIGRRTLIPASAIESLSGKISAAKTLSK